MSGAVSSLISPELNLKQYICNNVNEIIRILENLSHDRKEYDHAVYKLEHVIQIGVRSEVQGLWQRTFLNELLNDLIVAYNKLLEEESQPFDGTRQPSVVYAGAAGRPLIDIPRQTLKMYLNFGFSLIKISEMLGVSQKTISRTIRQFGLLEEVPRYTEISNENLDTVAAEIYHELPNCGVRRMKGFLNAKGMRIQWERVRASLWRIDPEGILMRTMQLNLVQRRHYSVPGPLA